MPYDIFGIQIHIVFNLILAVSIFMAFAETALDWNKKLGYWNLIFKLSIRSIRNLGFCFAIAVIAMLFEIYYITHGSDV